MVLTAGGDRSDRNYMIAFDARIIFRVKNAKNHYRVNMTIEGKKSEFIVYKKSPYDIIPQQAERAEKFIEIMCKAAKVDIPSATQGDTL